MGKIVNMHEAKTHFSSLAELVESGDEVIIARAGKPIMKLVHYSSTRPPAGTFAKEWANVDIDALLEPASADEISSWVNGPI